MDALATATSVHYRCIDKDLDVAVVGLKVRATGDLTSSIL